MIYTPEQLSVLTYALSELIEKLKSPTSADRDADPDQADRNIEVATHLRSQLKSSNDDLKVALASLDAIRRHDATLDDAANNGAEAMAPTGDDYNDILDHALKALVCLGGPLPNGECSVDPAEPPKVQGAGALTLALRPLPLALAFAAQIRAALTPECVSTIVARNATEEYSQSCSTHDFCDSNMLMAAAFAETFGREPFTPSDIEGGAATDEVVDADTSAWNKAWNLAKSGDFDDAKITEYSDEEILRDATQAALDEACRTIQNHLGISNGEIVGTHFTGARVDEFKSMLKQYLEAERLARKDD